MLTIRISVITPCSMGDILSLLHALNLGAPDTFHQKIECYKTVYIISYKNECCITDAFKHKIIQYEERRKHCILPPYYVTHDVMKKGNRQIQMYYLSIV